MANSLMNQKVHAYAARNAENKRKFENQPQDNRVQQPPFKRQNVARAYTASTNEKKAYAGHLPYCNKCKLHNARPCTVKCSNCKKIGHMARECHYRSDCPKLKNQNRGNQAANTKARGRVFTLGGGETNKDSNVIMDLMPVELGSFEVIIGMNWLSKNHVIMVYDEKIVQIPYGDEVLTIQVTKKEVKDKSEENRLEDVPIVRDFSEVFPEDLHGLPPTRQVEFQIDLVPGAAP
ncbi:putative reverse transcriptase domain-containing protein, partial [Tanacetum coccineum]